MSKEKVCTDYQYRTCHAGKFWKAVLPLMATITAPDSAATGHSPYLGMGQNPVPLVNIPEMNRIVFCCCLHAHYPRVTERQTMHLTVGVTQGEPSERDQERSYEKNPLPEHK